MSDLHTDPELPSPRPQRRRWLRRLLMGLPLLAVPVAVAILYFCFRPSPLAEARAELDQLDPGWRLEVIEAGRAVIPDQENAALLVQAVYRQMPKHWPTMDRDNNELCMAVENALTKLPPPVRLEAAHLNYLTEGLEEVEALLVHARKLAEQSRGRFSVIWGPDGSPTTTHWSEIRTVGRLLEFDALIRAQDGDLPGALTSLRAVCNTYRAIGDEPSLISMLVRYAGRGRVGYRLERLLAQGEIREPDLEHFQKHLEDEAAVTLLLIGLRGERAGFNRLTESIERGLITPSELEAIFEISSALASNEQRDDPSPLVRLGLNQVSRRQGNFADCLRLQTDAIEIARLPWARQSDAWAVWNTRKNQTAEPGRSMLLGLEKTGAASQRTQALLHCAITLLAVERFRIRQGRWPESLGELCPAYLPQVLTDPYDGRPLRYRRLPDGVLIYSVGPDGKDNGGNIPRPFIASQKDIDLGLQLWDVPRRRQPASEPAEVLPVPPRIVDETPATP